MENDSNIVTDTGATQSDAPVANVDNRTEDQMLGDLLRTSAFTEGLFDDEAPTEEHSDVPAPTESQADDDLEIPVVDEDMVEEAVEEEVNPEDDTSTQEGIYEIDDLEDFQVWAKIDGEKTPVSLSELIKSYQTDQHLSNKGRELGDARKQLDEEKRVQVEQIDSVISAADQILSNSENAYAREYHALNDQIEQARLDDDTEELTRLKDKQEQVQKKYWNASEERKQLVAQAEQQKQTVQNEDWNRKLQHFQENVSSVIPDWSEDVAMANREFALSKGIPEQLLGTMVDLNVIKLVMISVDLRQALTRGRLSVLRHR